MNLVAGLVVVAAVVLDVSTPQQVSQQPMRPVTLTGCVQSTADPAVFLLAVPGDYPDPVRGIATGEPVPSDAGAGPAPRSNPLANPPVGAGRESELPSGRYSTPTVQNRSYRLTGLDASKLQPLIGQAIEVVGEVPVAGFPSGDVPADGIGAREPSPLGSILRAKSFKAVAASCAALMRQE
jgi:hypothetical protein